MEFTKMEGLGNDYVYIDCLKKSEQEINYISKLAQKISDRHFGIGSDGLILICKSENADFKMKMYNQDGSEAQMCGNGIRCVGKFVYDKGLTNNKRITIETLAGIKTLDLNIENGKVNNITVNMGKPILQEELIPCIADAKTENKFNNYKIPHIKLKVLDKDFDFTCVSMGNPHAITIVNNIDDFDVKKYGKIIECDKHFPQKTNVEFIEIIDDSTIKMRVWERGAGETLACGTGASASVVVCILNNLINNNQETKVKLLGGDLNIKWNEYVYMTGPARIVYEGVYND
ncbi:MAG: diaminopimelate epimerase [Clostridia bacterium]|nr:diaminopimelate epimerase [Clostridia bacterium]